jgi:peptidoglycan/xylan/chitin deacetylase (PgdA/CDA1 family)
MRDAAGPHRDGIISAKVTVIEPQFRSQIKRAARSALSAGPWYQHALRRHAQPGVATVLMYHTLGADDEPMDAWTVVRRRDFLDQLALLRAHYRIVSLDAALQGDEADGKPQAVLTFDDGDVGLHRWLLPLLDEQALPVTIYIATRQIESGQPYWFDRVMNAAQIGERRTVSLAAWGLGEWALGHAQGEAHWLSLGPLLDALKTLGDDAREAATDHIVSTLAAGPRRRVTPLAPLTLAQLQALAASPWVTIGAHTHGHDLLDQLPHADAARSIGLSRERLQSWTGQVVRHFAYPNGNHTEALTREVQSQGFQSAMSTRTGLWVRGESRYAMRRVPVGRFDDLARFKLNLLGGAAGLWRAAPRR